MSRKIKTNTQTVAAKLDTAKLATLGTQIGTIASQHATQGGNIWCEVRTRYVEAQGIGQAREAVAAIFTAGDAVKGKKAPWYRTYKCILNGAAEHGVTLTDAMSMGEAQKAVKAAKDAKADPDTGDAEAAAAKDEQLLGLFEKMAQGCLNRGIPKARLAAILKGLEA